MKSVLIIPLVRWFRGVVRLPDHVAGAWNRSDQRIRETLIDFFSQPVDMHVDDVATRLEIIIPGGFQQHGARNDLAGVADQLFEEQEFASSKGHRSSRPYYSRADRVEYQVANPQHQEASRAIGPTAKRREARQKLRE